MATKEQYLNALLNAKNNAIQNNSVLVNPSNTTTQLSSTSEQEILPQTANQNSEAKWYEKVFGFIDDVAREFGSGFVRGWEGIGDFILTGVSAIGEATGNDMSELNDYIKLDLGGLAGQWTQSYMNFTPWGIVKNIKNYGDSEYWNNFAQDTIANLDLAFGGLGGHNQSDIDKVIENNRKYAINNASTLTDMGETGEFIGGVAGSIGQLLPSIMIGNAVGSVASAGKGVQSLSKLGQNVVKGIQYGAFGLGAGGQGSQEALNDGASSKQALAYGTMVGAIEVGTELASAGLGKFGAKIVGSNTKLGKVLANSKFGGFDILKKSVGTASIGQLAKDMVEEGLEEVASEILSPLAKSIYKGSSALDEYGTDEYWKQVGLSFASGAVMSGFLSGTQQVYIKNSLGNNGVKVVNNIEKLSSTQQSLLQEFENAKTEQERQEVLNKAQKSGNAKLLKETIDLIDNLNEKQKVNLLKFYISPEQAIEEFKNESIANYGENSIDKKLENKIIDSYYKSDKAKNRFISSLNTNYKDFGVYVANEISQKISERTGKNLNIKISNKKLHDDKGNIVHALYDGKDTIVVNKKYRSQLYGAISHEGFVHAFSNMSKDAFNQFRKYITEGEGQKIYNEIMKTKGKETIWGEKLKDKTLEEAVRETYKESSNAVIEEELLAHFMQELIKDGNRFNQVLENNNGKSVIKKLINKVKSSIDKTGITSLINQYQKAIDNIDAKKTSESNKLGLVMYSLKPNTTKKDFTINNKRISAKYYERQNSVLLANKNISKYNVIEWSEQELKNIQSNENIDSVVLEGLDYSFYIGKFHLKNEFPTILKLNPTIRKLSIPTLKTIMWNIAKGKPQTIFYNGNYEMDVKVYTNVPAPKINGQKSVWVLNLQNVRTDFKKSLSKGVQVLNLTIETQEQATEKVNPISYEGERFFIGVMNAKSKRFKQLKKYEIGKSLNEYFDEETNEQIKNGELVRFYVRPSTMKLELSSSAVLDKITNEGLIYKDSGERESIRKRLKLPQKAIRYSKSLDNEGNVLTQEQENYFSESKVRDNDGNLLVLYHGTTNAGFSVFNNTFYNASSNNGYDNSSITFLSDRIEDGANNYSYKNEVINSKDLEKINVAKKYYSAIYSRLKSISDANTFANYFNEHIDLIRRYNSITSQINDYQDIDINEIVYDGANYNYRILDNEGFFHNYNFKKEKRKILDLISMEDYPHYFGNYKVYVNIKNPLIIDCKKQEFNELNIKTNIKAVDDEINRIREEKISINTDDVVNSIARNTKDFDGVIFKNIYDGSTDLMTVYVVIRNSNQIKFTDNLNPTDNEDIRYSKSLDSNGQKLSVEQEQYFKDSKVRDSNNNLITLYRGDVSRRTIFKNWRHAYFFTNNLEMAKTYGNKVEEVYLNITNPFVIDAKGSLFSNIDFFDDYEQKRVQTLPTIQNKINKMLSIFDYSSKWFSDLRDYFKEQDITIRFESYGNGNMGIVFGKDSLSNHNINRNIVIEQNIGTDNQNDISKGRKALENGFNKIFSEYTSSFTKISTDEIGEYARSKGYDGVIINNVVDYGGESENKDYPPSDVYITFNSNQSKRVNNYAPTSNDDIRYSKALDGNENKTSYINYETTQEIVNDFENELKTYFGENTRVSYPKGLMNFQSKSFSEINKVKNEELEGRNLANLFLETTIRYKDKVYGEEVGKVFIKELLTPTEQDNLSIAITNIIRTKPKTEARDNAVKQLKITLERLKVLSNEYKSMLKPSVEMVKYVIRAKDNIGLNYKIDNNAVERDGLKFLLKPFAEMKIVDGKVSVKGLEKNIKEVLLEYNNNNFDDEMSALYHQEIVDMYQDLLDTIGEPQTQLVHHKDKTITERDVYGYLNSEQLTIANNLARAINQLVIDTARQKAQITMPIALSTYQAIDEMSYGNKTDIVSKTLRKWKRGFAPSYIVVREITGFSTLSEIITTEGQKAQNDKTLYLGKISDEINQKIKELGIKNKISKKIVINNVEMTMQQAMYLYLSTQIDANKEQIALSGAVYYDKNGRPVQIIGKGTEIVDADNNSIVINEELDNFINDLDEKLPTEFKEFSNFILSKFNNQFKADYIEWYEKTFGKYNNRNEIGKVGENSYFPLYRYVKRESSVEMMARVMGGVFTNAKRRYNNTHPVIIGDVLSTTLEYAERLSREKYIKPVYRKVVSILNQKVSNGQTLKELINAKVDPQDLPYLTRTLQSFVGVNVEQKSTPIDNIMSNFALAKLSINIGSALKQYASIWTSNIPLKQSTRALMKRAFKDENYKTIFNELVDEIGGIKYRKSGSGVVEANVGTLKGKTKEIAKKGMALITANDYFTISVGVYGLIGIGANELNADITKPSGRQLVKQFVIDNWTEFELSQIGNTSLSQSSISRGDYDSIVKAVFGFLQGANRASFGSQINKLDTWIRNKNLNEESIKQDFEKWEKEKGIIEEAYKQQETNLDNARKEYFEGNRTKDLLDKYALEKQKYEQVRQTYIDVNAKYEYSNTKYNDYKRYKLMGGKKIPLNIASGLVAQGIFVALVSELMKFLKGRKDWDELVSEEGIKEISLDLLLSICADWLPLVNNISSLLQGYETSIPTTEVLNQISSVANALKTRNWRVAIRQISLAIGDMTGLPFQTIYQYVYGFIKMFNPEIAWKLNSLFYNSTESGANSSLKEYASRNNKKGVKSMISVLMETYKSTSDDEIDNELSDLYLSGYRALPNSYMTSYTNEKGEDIELNAQQIATFREVYNSSYQDIKDLLALGEYRVKTQEEKAKSIKSLYNAYYEYAKAISINTIPTNKYAKLLYYSNGKIKLAKYISIVNNVSKISENQTKTRKELVVSYINSLKGLTKQEKLLAMYLCGYSLNDGNRTSLSSYLLKLGMNKKVIDELLN